MSEIVLIVAASANGVIGKDGSIPWRLPQDMKRFKELTFGHTVVMGRKTWESFQDQKSAAAWAPQYRADAAKRLDGARRHWGSKS